MKLRTLHSRVVRRCRHIARRFDYRYHTLQSFIASRTVWLTAPYPLVGYEEILKVVTDHGYDTPRFSKSGNPGKHPDVYFRHDIDLAACPRQLPKMVEIELRYGISSGVYFQANDRAPYDLKSCRNLAHDLVESGIDVGLHTICYTAASPWRALANEKQRFQDALGMSPKSFNAHGLGSYMASERAAFYSQVTPNKLAEWGFDFSDLRQELRRYDHVIEDCHMSPTYILPRRRDPFEILPTEARAMRNDFYELPDLPGFRYLVLTHPGYWQCWK